MKESDNSAPEYSDDDDEGWGKKEEIYKDADDAVSAFKLVKHEDVDPCLPLPQKKFAFVGNPKHGKRMEKPPGAKGKPMVTTNIRPAREGTEFINDEVQIYYQNSETAKCVQPCTEESFDLFMKSSEIPESRQFLDPQLIRNLAISGITKLRPIQAAMMTSLFAYPYEHPEAGKADILATSKTGSGKTLAFLIPLVQKCIEKRDSLPYGTKQRLPTAIIFVNSAELALSVLQVFKEFFSKSGIITVAMAANLSFLETPYFDIGIATVGRFQNHHVKFLTLGEDVTQLNLSELEYIVIDEVDKMVMDSKFLSVLDHLIKEPKNPRIFGFSATIESDTSDIIRSSSTFQIKCGIHNSIAPNITQYFWETRYNSVTRLRRDGRGKAVWCGLENLRSPLHPFDTLYKGLTESKALQEKRIMVFCKRTRIADYIALRLTDYGVPAVSIHRKLEDIQTPIDMFNRGDVNIAIGTQYFTRGIDTDVDIVINYDLPIIPLDFIHRCGRTGRNGNTGIAITFIDLSDPINYNPEVVNQIVEELAKDKNSTAPVFLKKRVMECRRFFGL